MEIGGLENLTTHATQHMNIGLDWEILSLIFLSFFFGETLVPPYVQRLLIGKNIKNTIRGNMLSGLVSIPFFLIVGLIGVVAVVLDPYLTSQLALPSVVLKVMPVGLKGLAVAGMMAIIMSSADAFLNAASISITHDVLKPLMNDKIANKEIRYARLITYAVGLAGLAFTLSLESAIDMLLHSYMFWTPIILVPFVAGIMGIQRPRKVFWASVGAGIVTVLIMKMTPLNSAYFEVSIWGILANMLVFTFYRPSEKPVSFGAETAAKLR
jgi:SSS family solute:Na+ symporter